MITRSAVHFELLEMQTTLLVQREVLLRVSCGALSQYIMWFPIKGPVSFWRAEFGNERNLLQFSLRREWMWKIYSVIYAS